MQDNEFKHEKLKTSIGREKFMLRIMHEVFGYEYIRVDPSSDSNSSLNVRKRGARK